jgi:tetratricopeptide (TPR) repeat protein
LGVIEGTESGYYEESAAAFKEVGNDEGYTFAVWLLGCNSRDEGNLDRSEILLKESERLYQKMGSWQLGSVYYNLAYLYFKKGQTQQARSLFIQALPFVQEVGDQWGLMWFYFFKGEMELAEASDTSSLHRAEAILTESLKIARKFGNQQFFNLDIPVLIANKAQKLGECTLAVRRYRETLNLYQGFISKYKFHPDGFSNIGKCLLGLAEAAVCLNNACYGARLLGALDSLGALEKDVLRDINPVDIDRISELSRSKLAETDFQAAWGEGRSMTLEKAIALGLEDHE